MFRSFRTAIETEQGVRADLPLNGEEVAEEVGDGADSKLGGEADGPEAMGAATDAGVVACDMIPDEVTEWSGRPPIVPLRSSATEVRFETLAPGPDLGITAGTVGRAGGAIPSVLERQLRDRVGQMPRWSRTKMPASGRYDMVRATMPTTPCSVGCWARAAPP